MESIEAQLCRLAPKARFVKECNAALSDSHVWLQGFLTTVPSTTSGWYVLDDGTASIAVTPISALYPSEECDVEEGLLTGAYCCALGHVTEVSGRRVIAATSLRRVPSVRNAEATWLVTASAHLRE